MTSGDFIIGSERGERGERDERRDPRPGMTREQAEATHHAALDAGYPDIEVRHSWLNEGRWFVEVLLEPARGGDCTTWVPLTADEWRQRIEDYYQFAAEIERRDQARAAATGEQPWYLAPRKD